MVTADGDEALLSNSHVLALMGRAAVNDEIYQPGRPHKPTLLATAEIARLADYPVIGKRNRNELDAAVALLGNLPHTANRIPAGLRCPFEGRVIRRVGGYQVLGPDSVVCKVGCTTGFTKGKVTAIALDNVPVETSIGLVLFDNALEVQWLSNGRPFSRPGDSGSMVFAEDGLVAVGLHFAGGTKRVGRSEIGVSYSCSLEGVLNALNVQWLV